jgi:hypothetical protein
VKKVLKIALLSVLSIFLLAGSGAAQLLDFGVVAPTAGSISYAGADAPLVGTSIQVDNVVGIDTLLNDGVTRNLYVAYLNFETGAPTDVWEWGGGSTTSISLIGAVDLNDNGVYDPGIDIPSGTTLMTGTFGTAYVVPVDETTFKISGGLFFDIKEPALLEFYGLPTFLPDGSPFPYVGNFNLSFITSTAVSGGEAFASATVLSGDIINRPVPEPGTMLLLGTGLVGFSVFSRRKFFKNLKR